MMKWSYYYMNFQCIFLDISEILFDCHTEQLDETSAGSKLNWVKIMPEEVHVPA